MTEQSEVESGVAARIPNEFAADLYPYLDEAARKKMDTAHSDLMRKFQEIAFDESAEMRWQESQRAKEEGIDEVPAETDLQK